MAYGDNYPFNLSACLIRRVIKHVIVESPYTKYGGEICTIVADSASTSLDK